MAKLIVCCQKQNYFTTPLPSHWHHTATLTSPDFAAGLAQNLDDADFFNAAGVDAFRLQRLVSNGGHRIERHVAVTHISVGQ